MPVPGSLLVCGLLIAVSALVSADEIGAPDSVRNGTEQVLVLTSGRVLNGRITPRPDGYEVQLSAGRMFVSSSMVRFQASDLNDAYLKLRQSLPELTPNHHVELAKWCETNGLNAFARRELLDALHLDPNRGDAKRMLQALLNKLDAGRVDGMTNTDSARETASGGSLTVIPAAAPAAIQVQTRSLGGFSKPIARAFVQNVQPMLVNKCASGGCHAGGSDGFVLVWSRSGSTPFIAERNLAAVLNQLDLNHPESSPLLKAAEGSHGGTRGSIFTGRTGNVQLGIIRSWVDAVAAEIGPSTDSQMTAFAEQTGRPEAVTPVSANFDDFSATDVVPAAVGIGDPPDAGTLRREQLSELERSAHGTEVSLEKSDARVLQEIERMNRRDAFDPAIFNQKYHTNPSSRATTSGNAALRD